MNDEREENYSEIFEISSWPKGTRTRGWGWLHDEIWFYRDPPWKWTRESLLRDLQAYPLHEWWIGDDGEINIPPYEPYVMGGEIPATWRMHNGRWMVKYLERYMIWFGRSRGTLRYHVFNVGDSPVPHDHPWWFVTFPLGTYKETVELPWDDPAVFDGEGLIPYELGGAFVEKVTHLNGYRRVLRSVSRFRFHFRPPLYRHWVHDPAPGTKVRTLVISGPVVRIPRDDTGEKGHDGWGFWPSPTHFVPWRKFSKYQQQPRGEQP